MTKTSIEWTGHTWNPTKGCSLKSPGCTNCFAMKEAYRFGFNPKQSIYHGLTKRVNGKAVWTGEVRLSQSTLFEPLLRKIPSLWFVNSMSDLAHEDIPDAWRDQVFAVMALTPQHTYQILTKRSAIMRGYINDPDTPRRVYEIACDIVNECQLTGVVLLAAPSHEAIAPPGRKVHLGIWPLPNVWLGVSAEDQQRADERVPDLLSTPAAVRFISAEPLLGPIDLTALTLSGVTSKFDALKHGATYSIRPEGHRFYHITGQPILDWVIVGGENGPRPMHPDWARSLRDQCANARVPFFFKQWGSWYPQIDCERDDPDGRQPYTRFAEPRHQILNLAGGRGFHGERVHVMRRGPKSRNGRALDGMEHRAMPEAAR